MMYRRIMLACSLWLAWSVPSSAKHRNASQPLPVDRVRRQRPVRPARVRQVPQPAADQAIEEVRADGLDQGADPGLARGDDPPQQRVHLPAQPGEDLLRQVSGMVTRLPEVPRPASAHAAATARTKTSR
jgi:hypothetical protein